MTLTSKEIAELNAVIKNASVVADNLARQGNLIEAGVISSACQAIRWLATRIETTETTPDVEIEVNGVEKNLGT